MKRAKLDPTSSRSKKSLNRSSPNFAWVITSGSSTLYAKFYARYATRNRPRCYRAYHRNTQCLSLPTVVGGCTCTVTVQYYCPTALKHNRPEYWGNMLGSRVYMYDKCLEDMEVWRVGKIWVWSMRVARNCAAEMHSILTSNHDNLLVSRQSTHNAK